jgi:hypothetical protein
MFPISLCKFYDVFLKSISSNDFDVKYQILTATIVICAERSYIKKMIADTYQGFFVGGNYITLLSNIHKTHIFMAEFWRCLFAATLLISGVKLVVARRSLEMIML